jgi:hypothetical protein
MMLIFATGLGTCGDAVYVFGEYGPQPLDYAHIDAYNETELLAFSTTEGPDASGTGKVKTIHDLTEEFNSKVDVNDPLTREMAVVLAAKYPGARNIAQICSIHEYLTQGWKYVSDPTGIDFYQSASESIRIGEKANCSGAGDCDDFAILMAALIESVGSTARIILAYNPDAGHAYTEVYLGRLNVDQVEQIVTWLKQKYNVEEIFTHIDSDTNEVWLNLDWSSCHPGGPFYNADKQTEIFVRSEAGKIPLSVPDVSPSPTPENTYYGDVNVTIQSQMMKGYDVYLDDNYIGTEGHGGDVFDGVYKLNVVGNQWHTIKVWDGEWFYGKPRFYERLTSVVLQVEPASTSYVSSW